jgi:hypothetical protein
MGCGQGTYWGSSMQRRDLENPALGLGALGNGKRDDIFENQVTYPDYHSRQPWDLVLGSGL